MYRKENGMSDSTQSDLKVATQSSSDANDTLHVWVTTIDNPFDPFTDFDNWYRYDESKGYCTSGYLARYCNSDDSDLSDTEYEKRLDNAITKVLNNDFIGEYIKVRRVDGATIPPIRTHEEPRLA